MTPTHTQILRLARSGSPERAWSLMQQHGLLDSETDQRSLTLQARLVKDRAKRAGGAERARLFGEAAAIYAKAGALDPGSYPLINGASLSLLAGRAEQSRRLAQDVLAALDANPDEAETPYWLGATRAEALLLLGQETEARAALRGAVTKQPAAWEDHAATIGQFELLCEELGCDAAWLDQVRPPAAIQFSGIMHVAQDDAAVRAQIDDWLEREKVGFGYGALAAGSDIWIAEALIDRGAQLHVVLPCDAAAFRRVSVAVIDGPWALRFDRLMEQASSVHCLDHAAEPSTSAVTRGDVVAVGMAARNAFQLRSNMRRLRIDGADDPTDPERDGDIIALSASRLSQPASTERRPAGSLVALLATKDGPVRSYTDLADAIAALPPAGGTAALDWIVVGADTVPTTATDRLSAMLDCAQPGQILVTHAAGFGVLGSRLDITIESAGEMRWVGGQTPLFAII